MKTSELNQQEQEKTNGGSDMSGEPMPYTSSMYGDQVQPEMASGGTESSSPQSGPVPGDDGVSPVTQPHYIK